MNFTTRCGLKFLLLCMTFSLMTATFAHAASVTLRWDPNDPAPQGYRVFAREGSQGYNYDHPLWENNLTTCTLTGLTEGVTYHFVVRAFDGELESADSEEVSYSPAAAVANQAPTADAGQNQVSHEGSSVTLDGSGSSDTDGSIVAYQWVQTGGSGISIGNASHAQATFTAPIVGLAGENFTFSLTVTDNDGASSVAHLTVSVLKSSSTDVDGDGVPDVLDSFPDDPAEWADNDGDGIGNNQDPDDDNDGMPDAWELAHGLDPFTDDSELDADGDGFTNLAEFQMGGDPTAAAGNSAPDAPVIDGVTPIDRVGLTPVLVAGAYFDDDQDAHHESQWQISTEPDFSTLILDAVSQTQLTAYTVGEMILDADTVYHWRVRFIDARKGTSNWSEPATFTTVNNADDANFDGVPDAQAVDASADVNENAIPDHLEDNIMTVNTVEGQTMVGVESLSENVTLVAIKSLPTGTLADQSVKMGFGLVGFKLYLQAGVKTAAVKIHFSSRVPKTAQLYKYLHCSGWEVYPNAIFDQNRKSVTLVLEDGGAGDEDGVENGVIVDPSGIAYADDVTADSASLSTGGVASAGSGGGRSCFISAGIGDQRMPDGLHSKAAVILITLLLGAGAIFTAASRPEIRKANLQIPAAEPR
ncbi:choice-of-anchor U domain-containing protein [Desulfosarcina sp.]|uniref:choice-of-anchor U domain-containing protein n=1 Tax=Desulfosarcina sp. TaxID=2027861 RepID=UPI003970DD49